MNILSKLFKGKDKIDWPEYTVRCPDVAFYNEGYDGLDFDGLDNHTFIKMVSRFEGNRINATYNVVGIRTILYYRKGKLHSAKILVTDSPDFSGYKYSDGVIPGDVLKSCVPNELDTNQDVFVLGKLILDLRIKPFKDSDDDDTYNPYGHVILRLLDKVPLGAFARMLYFVIIDVDIDGKRRMFFEHPDIASNFDRLNNSEFSSTLPGSEKYCGVTMMANTLVAQESRNYICGNIITHRVTDSDGSISYNPSVVDNASIGIKYNGVLVNIGSGGNATLDNKDTYTLVPVSRMHISKLTKSEWNIFRDGVLLCILYFETTVCVNNLVMVDYHTRLILPTCEVEKLKLFVGNEFLLDYGIASKDQTSSNSILMLTKDNGGSLRIPDNCPSCGSRLGKTKDVSYRGKEVHLPMCSNSKCPGIRSSVAIMAINALGVPMSLEDYDNLTSEHGTLGIRELFMLSMDELSTSCGVSMGKYFYEALSKAKSLPLEDYVRVLIVVSFIIADMNVDEVSSKVMEYAPEFKDIIKLKEHQWCKILNTDDVRKMAVDSNVRLHYTYTCPIEHNLYSELLSLMEENIIKPLPIRKRDV